MAKTPECGLCGSWLYAVRQDADLVPYCERISSGEIANYLDPPLEGWQLRQRIRWAFGLDQEAERVPERYLGDSKIERIKKAVPCLDVACRLTQMRRAGRAWRGKCPFHRERTPSFYVWPESERWHCFGACATGGDVIDLYRKAFGEMPNG